MRLVWFLLLAVAGLGLSYLAWKAQAPDYVPPTAVPAALPDVVPAGFEVRRFAVEGMCCDGCSKKLRDALLAVEGVREVAVDVGKGEAACVVPAETDGETLAAALTFGEYRARALP